MLHQSLGRIRETIPQLTAASVSLSAFTSPGRSHDSHPRVRVSFEVGRGRLGRGKHWINDFLSTHDAQVQPDSRDGIIPVIYENKQSRTPVRV